MGKCNLNPLYLIGRDIDLSSINLCDFIVDCLVRTKKVYNPEKESSFFYGPTAYLMVQCQESDYNEDESGGYKDEFDGDEDLCDEDEEEFDVNKVSAVEGGGNGPHEENIRKNDFEGKGGVNDHAYEDNIGKNNDQLNKKEDEDNEQGNGSGCNEEEAMNLNFVFENVTKSVGLIDSQEEIVNLSKDDHNKEVISDHTVDKDGEGVVEGEGVEVDSDLGKSIEDCSNKIKMKDSNETSIIEKGQSKGKVEKFYGPSFSLGFSQIFKVPRRHLKVKVLLNG
ncbi:unnamed protein product [Lactuca saligna]|uniref:Uncharacterized protein n=1 Tax=Lactuca saligna TaxID=75948 RepID=A0AA35YYS3_LACSI|nr:unnamed protein product [Lactuca saligna]